MEPKDASGISAAILAASGTPSAPQVVSAMLLFIGLNGSPVTLDDARRKVFREY